MIATTSIRVMDTAGTGNSKEHTPDTNDAHRRKARVFSVSAGQVHAWATDSNTNGKTLRAQPHATWGNQNNTAQTSAPASLPIVFVSKSSLDSVFLAAALEAAPSLMLPAARPCAPLHVYVLESHLKPQH